MLPFTAISERLGEDVCYLFGRIDIDHIKEIAFELLLDPCERKTLSSIGVSKLLAVTFQEDSIGGLIIL